MNNLTSCCHFPCRVQQHTQSKKKQGDQSKCLQKLHIFSMVRRTVCFCFVAFCCVFFCHNLKLLFHIVKLFLSVFYYNRFYIFCEMFFSYFVSVCCLDDRNRKNDDAVTNRRSRLPRFHGKTDVCVIIYKEKHIWRKRSVL